MRTIAYFDCFSGISGDMILGALVDSGLPLLSLQKELARLKVSGYELSAEKTERHAISGTKVEVTLTSEQSPRHLGDILEIIRESTLSDIIKGKATKIFHRLAEAEARVHDTSPETVHFHEVGATDAVVDVLGAVIGLDLLHVDEVYASAPRLGSGFVRSEHGNIPVPAPATVELLKDVPTIRTGIQSELVTPTGAAIITTLATSFVEVPTFRTQAIGYGAGSRRLREIPNLLRVEIGQRHASWLLDRAVVIETNIDDMNPELYSYLQERLLGEGALDVYLTQVIMKKGRPGVLLSVLGEPQLAPRFADIIMKETTTLGLRLHMVDRWKTAREQLSIDTPFGPVRVKHAEIDGEHRYTAEFEDCRRIASERHIPLRSIYEEVHRALFGRPDLKDVE